MQAGRELDALVAESVMGWKFRVRVVEHRGMAKVMPEGTWNNGRGHSTPDLPHFSTNIADAWEVVEAFRRGITGHPAACIEMHVSDAVDENDCSCKIYAPDFAEVIAFANEMPLAICLASLAALGVNLPEA